MSKKNKGGDVEERKYTRRVSTAFGTNFSHAVKPAELGIDFVGALASVITYVFFPTWFKMKGIAAMLTGAGITWVFGAAFNVPSMRSSAFVLPMVHLIYAEFRGKIEEFLGNDLWVYGDPVIMTTTTTTTTKPPGIVQGIGRSDLQEGAQVMRIPSSNGYGETNEVVVYGNSQNSASSGKMLPTMSGVGSQVFSLNGLGSCQGGTLTTSGFSGFSVI